MAFHKRRIKPSPNKNKAKALRRQGDNDLPTMEQRWPDVDRLTVQLHFSNPQGYPAGDEILEFGPSDLANFDVSCVGPCGDGKMDLAGKISDMMSKRETTSEARGKCQRVVYAGTGEVCGHELRCRIDIAYR
jgi:hypothetical protein